MPFEGPQGQGPFEDFDDCVESMADEPGVEDPEALCAVWMESDENQANAMTQPDHDVQYRQHYRAHPDDITVRDIDDEEDGLFAIRMPIASTGEVRNEGDEPLTREEIDGMARQINERDVGVFLAHGDSFEITDARYGQTERLGNWRDGEVETREDREEESDADLLFASAEMMDPETLPNIGPIRDALGTLKEQAKRNIGISSSIGWREADDHPGGNDLMEASIVGIPADPRTVTQAGPAVAVARAAIDAGADPEALVEAVRAAVTGDRDSDALDHTLGPTVGIEMATDKPLEEGELYCGPTDSVYDGFTLSAEIDCPGCGRTLDGLELAADLNDSGKPRLTNDMTDESDPDDEQSGTDESDEEQTEERQDDVLERLLELQEDQMDVLQSIDEAVREDDDEEDEDDEDENATDEDDDEEDEDEENAADTEQAAEAVEALREQLEAVRSGDLDPEDLDLPDADDEQSADDTDDDRDADTGDADPADSYNKYGLKPT